MDITIPYSRECLCQANSWEFTKCEGLFFLSESILVTYVMTLLKPVLKHIQGRPKCKHYRLNKQRVALHCVLLARQSFRSPLGQPTNQPTWKDIKWYLWTERTAGYKWCPKVFPGERWGGGLFGDQRESAEIEHPRQKWPQSGREVGAGQEGAVFDSRLIGVEASLVQITTWPLRAPPPSV